MLHCLLILTVAATIALTAPALWILIANALIFSAVDALFMPAVGALPPRLTSPDQLARVTSMRSLSIRLSRIAGPPIGGLAMGLGGAAATFTVAGLLFALSQPLLLTMRLRSLDSRDEEQRPAGTAWQNILDGLRYIRRRLIFPLVLAGAISELGLTGTLNVGMVLLNGERGWDYRVEVSQHTDVDMPTDLNPVVIGPATEDDLPGIVAILNYAVSNSIATFATRPTSVAERRDWFEQFSSTGPYRLLVARRGNLVVGYAGSQRYRDHEAFRETVEVSIALDVSCRGQGVGTLLYRALFDCLADEPVHVVLAGIAMPNDASVALHRKFGFTEVGTFREYAIKNGQYISSLWMQRLSPTVDQDR